MRDPYRAAQANPNLMSLGLRIRAAWESFVKQYPGATKCDEGGRDVWHAPLQLRRLANRGMEEQVEEGGSSSAPPAVAIKGRLKYKSPRGDTPSLGRKGQRQGDGGAEMGPGMAHP